MLSERERAEDHYLNTVGYWIEKGKAEGIAQGESRGHAIGLAEGKFQGQIQMIIKLFRENTISLDVACQSLNLSADEFKQLL